MSTEELTALLGGWEGYRIGTVGRFEAGQKGPMAQAWIELLPDPEHRMICSGCGQVVRQVHETTERWVRDLPILGVQTHLLVHRLRVLCPRCGPKLEELPWLGRYQRVTRRLAESVARLTSYAKDALGTGDPMRCKDIVDLAVARGLGTP